MTTKLQDRLRDWDGTTPKQNRRDMKRAADRLDALEAALREANEMLLWYYDQYADSDASKVIARINELLEVK